MKEQANKLQALTARINAKRNELRLAGERASELRRLEKTPSKHIRKALIVKIDDDRKEKLRRFDAIRRSLYFLDLERNNLNQQRKALTADLNELARELF